MSNVNEDRWKSKDFYLSCVIRASGFELINLERNEHDFSVFVFDISPQKAEEIISLHWSKQLKLPTRDLIEAINELRTRLKSGV
jgi:hypothetical protein